MRPENKKTIDEFLARAEINKERRERGNIVNGQNEEILGKALEAVLTYIEQENGEVNKNEKAISDLYDNAIYILGELMQERVVAAKIIGKIQTKIRLLDDLPEDSKDRSNILIEIDDNFRILSDLKNNQATSSSMVGLSTDKKIKALDEVKAQVLKDAKPKVAADNKMLNEFYLLQIELLKTLASNTTDPVEKSAFAYKAEYLETVLAKKNGVVAESSPVLVGDDMVKFKGSLSATHQQTLAESLNGLRPELRSSLEGQIRENLQKIFAKFLENIDQKELEKSLSVKLREMLVADLVKSFDVRHGHDLNSDQRQALGKDYEKRLTHELLTPTLQREVDDFDIVSPYRESLKEKLEKSLSEELTKSLKLGVQDVLTAQLKKALSETKRDLNHIGQLVANGADIGVLFSKEGERKILSSDQVKEIAQGLMKLGEPHAKSLHLAVIAEDTQKISELSSHINKRDQTGYSALDLALLSVSSATKRDLKIVDNLLSKGAIFIDGQKTKLEGLKEILKDSDTLQILNLLSCDPATGTSKIINNLYKGELISTYNGKPITKGSKGEALINKLMEGFEQQVLGLMDSGEVVDGYKLEKAKTALANYYVLKGDEKSLASLESKGFNPQGDDLKAFNDTKEIARRKERVADLDPTVAVAKKEIMDLLEKEAPSLFNILNHAENIQEFFDAYLARRSAVEKNIDKMYSTSKFDAAGKEEFTKYSKLMLASSVMSELMGKEVVFPDTVDSKSSMELLLQMKSVLGVISTYNLGHVLSQNISKVIKIINDEEQNKDERIEQLKGSSGVLSKFLNGSQYGELRDSFNDVISNERSSTPSSLLTSRSQTATPTLEEGNRSPSKRLSVFERALSGGLGVSDRGSGGSNSPSFRKRAPSLFGFGRSDSKSEDLDKESQGGSPSRSSKLFGLFGMGGSSRDTRPKSIGLVQDITPPQVVDKLVSEVPGSSISVLKIPENETSVPSSSASQLKKKGTEVEKS